MFIVKDDDGKNGHKSYKSIYFNYFRICSNRVKLFLAMQVRVMAACMESQADILECIASAQSGRREVTVCFSPMSMVCTHMHTLPLTAERLHQMYIALHTVNLFSYCHMKVSSDTSS